MLGPYIKSRGTKMSVNAYLITVETYVQRGNSVARDLPRQVQKVTPGRDGRIHGHKPLALIIYLICHGWANSRGQNSWFQQLTCWWCRLRHMDTEHAQNIVALLWWPSGPQSLAMLPAKMLWWPSGPQSLLMLPAKMADRIMLPDKVTEMENSIGYHTSINQSEESISIRCIINNGYIDSNCPSLLFGETTSHLTSKWRGTFKYFWK